MYSRKYLANAFRLKNKQNIFNYTDIRKPLGRFFNIMFVQMTVRDLAVVNFTKRFA